MRVEDGIKRERGEAGRPQANEYWNRKPDDKGRKRGKAVVTSAETEVDLRQRLAALQRNTSTPLAPPLRAAARRYAPSKDELAPWKPYGDEPRQHRYQSSWGMGVRGPMAA